jgi:hypothetical protein
MSTSSTTKGFVCTLILLGVGFSSAGRSHGTQVRTLAIHDIQGTGSRSPFGNQIVATTGIVTGRKSNGFFLQTPDDAADGDSRSSEGLFVFTAAAPPAALTPGTLVSVTGRVIEFVPPADPGSPPLTELGDLLSVEVRGVGRLLPEPTELHARDLTPAGGHEQLEHLEGMRVLAPALTIVSPTLGSITESTATATSNGVFYGVLAGTSRPFREPGIDVRDELPAGAPCCVPRFDGNPERLRVDSDGQPGAPPLNVATGSVLRDLIGPLDFGFRSYTILPDPVTPPTIVAQPERAGARAPDPDEFTVASLNLQRFFDTLDDPMVSDPVLTPVAFQNRLTKASLYLRVRVHAPDVIAVQEVENLATLQALAATLNRDLRESGAPEARYEAYLEEGNDPGGIDVGVLVKRSRVDVMRITQEGRSDTFRNPVTGQPEILNDRPPLVLTTRVFSPVGPDPKVTVIANHLRSLANIESPAAGPRVRAKRAAQAEFLAALVNRRLRDNPAEYILVVGDMNAYEVNDGYVDVVGTLRGAPAPRETTIVETRDLLDPDLSCLAGLQPVVERYSYVFDGTAQALDHACVSPTLLGQVREFAYVRGNADSPEIWRSDASRPERISDHDAALVYLAFPREPR